MKTTIALLLALALSGCAFTGTVKTPYGTVSRGADGVTNVEADLTGFSK